MRDSNLSQWLDSISAEKWLLVIEAAGSICLFAFVICWFLAEIER